MKYETPELTALKAINAIQSDTIPFSQKTTGPARDGNPGIHNETVSAYADWE